MTATTVTPLDVLRGVRDLIADQPRWTPHASAVNAQGLRVSPYSEDAVRWCVLGAAERIRYQLHGRDIGGTEYLAVEEACSLLRTAAKRRGWRHVADANDVGGHAVTLEVLDDAIASAMAEAES